MKESSDCNIYNYERILKCDNNHGYKIFKSHNISKSAFINFHKGDKPVQDSKPLPTDYKPNNLQPT